MKIEVRAEYGRGELRCRADGCAHHVIVDRGSESPWFTLDEINAAAEHRCPYEALDLTMGASRESA